MQETQTVLKPDGLEETALNGLDELGFVRAKLLERTSRCHSSHM